jgi:hypothetical protein
MTRFNVILAIVAALATVGFARAEDKATKSNDGPLLIAQLPAKPETKKYDLHYKISRGDVLRYDVTHQASIKGTSEKTTQSAQSKTDSVKAWKVTDVLPSGDIEFMNVVERVHMVNQLPDRKSTEYDSTRDKYPPPGFEDAARAVGVPLSTIRMTPHGKILSRQSRVRGQGADEDAPIVLRLPDKPVAVGDCWDESFDVKVNVSKGVTKSVKTRWHHKLADVKNGIATIEVSYQVLSPIDAPVELQLVQRMMTGEAQFDMAKGRIVGQKMNVDKRILGFAGPTSSLQYLMKMEEKLLKDVPKTAAKPKSKTNNNRRSSGTTKTTNRPQTQKQNRVYRQ